MANKTTTVLDMIKRFQNDPETAIVYADAEISYRDFVSQSLDFARDLADRGIQKGDRILLGKGRGIDYFTAMLGILMAGGAYIPVDPEWPSERKQQIMEDSGARMMVTDEGLISARGEKLPENAGSQEHAPLPEVSGEDAFAIFYTSGSTGKPKGTVVVHAVQHNNALLCGQNIFVTHTVNQCSSILSLLNPVYPYVILDIFLALCNRKRLILATEEEFHNAQALAGCMERREVDAMSITPSLLERYLKDDSFARAFAKVKRIALSGEGLSVKQADLFLGKTQGKLFNGYGSSEMLHCSDLLYESGQEICIGTPNEGVELHVLKEDHTPAEPEERGELYIGGVPARYGQYLNRDDLNAERYWQHPKLGRLFRTGDGAIRQKDGRIRVTGRIDGVMKLHGQRLDPGEIEQVIGQYPGIAKGAVTIHGEGSGAMLCGYYTASVPIAVPELRKWLSERLPHYMVPVRFMELSEMPVNARGKMDRKALPLPEESAEEVPYVAPANEREELLCGLFRDVLECPRPVGVLDSFFSLGGDSIKGMQIASAADAKGIRLRLPVLFANPTVRQLADVLKTEKAEPKAAERKPGNADLKTDLTAEEKKAVVEAVSWDNVEAVYPFLPTMWDRVRFDGDRTWLCAEMLTLDQKADEEQMKTRLAELVSKRQAMRTLPVFPEGSRPLNVVLKNTGSTLHTMDIREPGAVPGELSDGQKQKILSVLKAFRSEGFPKGQPTVRVLLIRTGPENRMLCILYSHFVLDGTGAHRVAEELLSDTPLIPDAEAVSLYYQRHADEKYCKDAMAYWKKNLAGLDGYTRLPGEPDPAAENEPAFRFRRLAMEPIQAYCRSHQVTPAAVIHAALGMAMAKTAGLEKVCFMTIGNGRDEMLTEDERLTGMFSCDYPFIYRAGEQPEDCQRHLLEGMSYMAYDYHQLGGAFTEKAAAGGTVRCNIMNYPMAKGAHLDNSFLIQDENRELLTVCPRDVLIYFIPGDDLYMSCVYLPGSIAPASVSAMIRAFVRSMGEILK